MDAALLVLTNNIKKVNDTRIIAVLIRCSVLDVTLDSLAAPAEVSIGSTSG